MKENINVGDSVLVRNLTSKYNDKDWLKNGCVGKVINQLSTNNENQYRKFIIQFPEGVASLYDTEIMHCLTYSKVFKKQKGE